MCSVLCVLCCFILLCHSTFSVLLYYFSVSLYSSVLLCCSLLFILLCSSTSCYVSVLDCIYSTLTLPPGVNPVAVNKYLSIYLSVSVYLSLIYLSKSCFLLEYMASLAGPPNTGTTRNIPPSAT